MNCLTYSLNYRIKNKGSKIYVEYAWVKVFGKIKKRKVLFRFLKFIGVKESFLFLTCPHFYIVHNGERIDLDPDNYNILRSNPDHVYDDLIECVHEISENIGFIEKI